MCEFDWWSLEKLSTLAKMMRPDSRDPIGVNLPPVSAFDPFWRDAASKCGLSETDDEAVEELAQDVHNEFDAWNDCAKERNVIYGDLHLAESRLMLKVKNIRGVVYVASHAMDALWKDDGIEYHTLLVSHSSLGANLSTQLAGVCSFLRLHEPALVCSSCPKLRTAVAIADLLQSGQARGIDSALERLREQAESGEEPTIGLTEREALESFAASCTIDAADELLLQPPLLVKTTADSLQCGEVLSPTSRARKRDEDAQHDAQQAHTGLTPKMRALDGDSFAIEPTGSSSPLRQKIFKREARLSEEAL